MKNLSRVVWSEGMYLGPHHFQAQSRYFEDSIQFVADSLWFEPFGLIGAEMDAEALRNGTVSVIHARGTFPDGLPFHMPDADALPPVRPITEAFPPTRDKVTIYLAIPPRRMNGVNCIPIADAGKDPAVRFLSEILVISDETTGLDEKPVTLGRKNVQILLDTELTGEEVALAVARVKRDGSGNFVYDPDFIPPCVDLAASERIMSITQRLVDILDEKSTALSTNKRASGKSWAEYSTTDIARFWMLHSIHAALPPLKHLLLTQRGHPEELYREMARLAGALCTFAIDSHPRSVPSYDHKKLDECFNALDDHIRRHLEIIVPTTCVSIPLTKTQDYFYTGEVLDQRCLDRARWVFAINSRVGEAEIIQRTPNLVKVCSNKFIGELVRRAVPGLSLTHLKVPPPAISARIDTQYFGVSRAGGCWDSIVMTRQVGIYVPGDLPEPEVELFAILE
ncbi:MAG: type VI secretion system baseplate subunit TssK [Bryobacteraceae bacterium]